MKTNQAARRIVKVRATVMCLALVGMVGAAFWLGGSLAARIGQSSGPQSEVLPVPAGSIADLVVAAG
jgi:hypothetical protein